MDLTFFTCIYQSINQVSKLKHLQKKTTKSHKQHSAVPWPPSRAPSRVARVRVSRQPLRPSGVPPVRDALDVLGPHAPDAP
jgi:hypothetical protein